MLLLRNQQVNVVEELRAEMFPHHMERLSDISYHSSSILGQIYDTVEAFKDEGVQETGW